MNKTQETYILHALFWYSATALALEVFLMRYFAAYLWDTLGAMVISVAMLGFGAAAPILFKLDQPKYYAALKVCGIVMSFFVSSLVLWLKFIPFNPYLLPIALKWWVPLIGLYLVLFLPFLSIGVFTGLVFKLIPEETGRVYAFSMVGAGIGALCIYGGFRFLLPENLYFIVLLLVIVGSLNLFFGILPKTKALTTSVLSFLPLALIPFYSFGTAYDQYKDIAQIRSFPNAKSTVKKPSTFGTFEVLESDAFHDLQGLFSDSPGVLPKQHPVFINGHYLTSLTEPKGLQLKETFTSLLFNQMTQDNLLVLGAGGGWEVLQALQYPFENIIAVEEVREIRPLLEKNYYEGIGDQVLAPNVEWRTKSIRSFLNQETETYEGILLTSQSFRHPSNNVTHTVENYSKIIRHLTLDGVFGLTVPIRQPPREGVRTLANVVYALKSLGVDPAEEYILAYRDHRQMGILVNRSPWLDHQVSSFLRSLKKHNLDVVYTKDVLPTEVNRFHQLPKPHYYLATRKLLQGSRQWAKGLSPFDVRPTFQDRPFFNFNVALSKLRELFKLFGKQMVAYVQLKEFMQLVILIQLIIGGFLLVFLPAFMMRRKRKQKFSLLLGLGFYFSLLGIAYISIEIMLIESLAVWVFGDYISSAAFVLSGLLISSGIGSYITEREIWFSFSPNSPTLCCVVVSALVLLTWAIFFSMSDMLSSMPFVVRTIISYIIIVPIGILMGMPFPTAFKKLLGRENDWWPWAYGFNGYFSVLGAPLAGLMVVSHGFMKMFLVFALCYALAALVWYSIRNNFVSTT